MRSRTLLAALAMAALTAACETRLGDRTVAEHCADPDNAAEAVCQLHVEIDGTRTALADTDLRLSEARDMADSAMAAASGAQATADEAMLRADAALGAVDDLYCETQTIQQASSGSCPAGFTLMSCTQTRYTYRAGGPSIIREINDESCRFHDRVLEMKVRCCTVSSNRPAAAALTAATASP